MRPAEVLQQALALARKAARRLKGRVVVTGGCRTWTAGEPFERMTVDVQIVPRKPRRKKEQTP